MAEPHTSNSSEIPKSPNIEDSVVEPYLALADPPSAEHQAFGREDFELEEHEPRSLERNNPGSQSAPLLNARQDGNPHPQAEANHHAVLASPQSRSSTTNGRVFKKDGKHGAKEEWRSWKLTWLWMVCLIFLETCMIVAIIYLERRSAMQNGIISVPQYTTFSISRLGISTTWKYGLLWTSLPSFVMTVYRLMWDTLVSGTSDRQPFVELKQSSTAKKTIMLDYRAYPSFFTPYKAFENGHVLLAASMILSLLMTIAVVPLTAHLFVALASQMDSPISLVYPTAYNESALTGSTSLQPAIDLATASRAYGGKPPPWMTLEYAFEHFEADAITQTGNITANVTAYSATLNCRALSEADSAATYTPSDSSGDGSVDYKFNDRDCAISGFVTVQNGTLTYARSWQSSCAGSQHGRIGIFAGVYSDTSDIKIANYSLISCISTYWNTTGSITVSVDSSSDPQFVSFYPISNTSFQPLLYKTLEQNLHSYTLFDASGTFWSDAFGLSIYNYAQTQNSLSPIMPDLIKSSTEDMFQALYAGLATKILIQQGATFQRSHGVLSQPVTRLYVVAPVAFTIVGVLALILLATIALLFYARFKHSVLLEEPIGLLGCAALLDGSQVSEFVSGFIAKHPGENDMRGFIKKNYTVEDSTCFMDEGSRKILVDGLVEKTSK